MTTPAELARWFDDAHHAVDTAPRLTVDQLRALVATPEQSRHDGTGRSTWWSEELARVATRKARDHFPAGGTDADVIAWKERQDRYSDTLEDLADAHAECLASARASPSPLRKPKPKRRTAADDALANMTPSHAIPDAA